MIAYKPKLFIFYLKALEMQVKTFLIICKQAKKSKKHYFFMKLHENGEENSKT